MDFKYRPEPYEDAEDEVLREKVIRSIEREDRKDSDQA
jgi:hypothetical protein